MGKPRVIAYYLPQFHPMPENDEWWGKGYTEWTSVAKAKSLYRGHEQPKIPADLGFYDLRVPETREAQAKLAKEAGIEGFCYWHYWFNGKRLMNRPFDEVLESGKPDFPFCLAWANHSWYNKDWTTTNGIMSGKSKLLIEQTYGGEDDYKAHFYALLPAFKDHRYIRVNDKPLFMIYNALDFPDFPLFSKIWNELAQKEGLKGFHFITHACIAPQIEAMNRFQKEGYDGINLSLHRMPFKSERYFKPSILTKILRRIKLQVSIKPEVVKYKDALPWMMDDKFDKSNIYPTIIPNWDHTPRSGNFGRVFQDCSPELFGKHVKMILDKVKHKPHEENLVFLKSWNEWGEGNYIEPDLKNGTGFLDVLKKNLESINDSL